MILLIFMLMEQVISVTYLPFYFFRYRFVRPSEMGEQRINQYIEGKYGKIGVQRYGLTST